MQLPFLIGHVSHFVVDKPQKLSINSKSYVIWKDNTNDLHILPDECPHLGASLSRGKVKYKGEKSCIQCPFHTLQFDSDGLMIGTNSKKIVDVPKLFVEQVTGLLYFLPPGAKVESVPNLSKIFEIKGMNLGGTTIPIIAESTFEKVLSISYDLNHVSGTHNDYFGIKNFKVNELNKQNLGDWHVKGTVSFEKFGLLMKIKKPNYFLIPETVQQEIFTFFPTLFVVRAVTGKIQFFQIVYFYPLDEKRSVIGGVFYSNLNPVLSWLLKKTSIESMDVLIEQDQLETQFQYDNHYQTISLPFDSDREEVVKEWSKLKDHFINQNYINRIAEF
ncbi:MAG: Rieske 2Fe-2S domain-containing protein [Patescibacteria group bacterium]